MLDIRAYDPGVHGGAVRAILEGIGWEARYVEGQLAALDTFACGAEGAAYVASADGRVAGFASVEYRAWNRLGQIQGLAVDPGFRRRGVAAGLVRRAEAFVRGRGARGLYVDTPVTNAIARTFYASAGYREAYTMPEYYDEGLDGVTYLKLFAPAVER